MVSDLPDLQGGQGGWVRSSVTGRTWSRHEVKPVGALHARLGGFLLSQWVRVPIPQVEGTATTWGLSPTSPCASHYQAGAGVYPLQCSCEDSVLCVVLSIIKPERLWEPLGLGRGAEV